MYKRILVILCVLIMALTLSYTTFADMLPWDNRNTDDIFVEIYTNHNVLTIDGSDLARNNLDYVVKVFDDSARASEPFYTQQLSGLEGIFVRVDFASSITRLRVELAYAENEGTKYKDRDDLLIISKTISLETGVQITSTAGESTNHVQSMIEYNVPKSISAYVFVNERVDIVNLNGKGSFSLELAEGYNKVEIQYSLDDPNIIYIPQFGITVNSEAPMLLLPEHRSAIYVDADEFVLAGVTDLGVLVTVDEVEIEVDSEGSFIHTVKLNNGENIFKVNATDKIGNKTEHDVIINKVNNIVVDNDTGNNVIRKANKKYLPLVLSFLGSIVLIIVVLIMDRGYKKSHDKGLYILRAIRNTVIVLTTICAGIIGYSLWKYLHLRRLSDGEGYFALANESIDKAYRMLTDLEFYGILLKDIGIATLTGVLIIVILALTLRIIKNRKFKTPETESPENSDVTTVCDTTTTTEIEDGINESMENVSESSLEDSKEIESTIDDQGSEEHSKEVTLEEQSSGIVCPECGTHYEIPVKFCGKCGRKM